MPESTAFGADGSQPRPTGGQTIGYFAARAAYLLLRWTPLPLAAAAMRVFGYLTYAALPRYRQRIQEQIATALQLDDSRAVAIARRVYPGLGLTLLEAAKYLDSPPGRLEARFAPDDDRDYLDGLVADSVKGVIFVTGHLGNWECAGALCGRHGWTEGSVARPQRNPLVDAWVNGLRRLCGQAIWQKKGALVHVLRALRRGRGVAFVADQDGGRGGLFAPFFGRPASTMAAPADLAMRTGAALVVGAVLRDGRAGRFRLRIFPPVYADPAADADMERLRLVTAVNERLEELIRYAPEQWLWTHRRWRTRPSSAATAPPAALGDDSEGGSNGAENGPDAEKTVVS